MGLLSGMSDDDRRAVLESGRVRRFGAREVVFHEGDPADTFLLIETGRLAVRAVSPAGDVVTFGVFGPGETVGELALIEIGGRRSATVVALEATEVRSFSAETFHRLRRTNAAADAFVLRTLADDVRRLSGLLLDALYLPVETRVLRRLADLEPRYRDPVPVAADATGPAHRTTRVGTSRSAGTGGNSDPAPAAPTRPATRVAGPRSAGAPRHAGVPTSVPLTQDELASLAGASRATVNRVLRAAEADGLVELRRGRILIVDPEGLRRRGDAWAR